MKTVYINTIAAILGLGISGGAQAQALPPICAEIQALDPAIVDDALEARCNLPQEDDMARDRGNVRLDADGQVVIDFGGATGGDAAGGGGAVATLGVSGAGGTGLSVGQGNGVSVTAGASGTTGIGVEVLPDGQGGAVASVGAGGVSGADRSLVDADALGSADGQGRLADADVLTDDGALGVDALVDTNGSTSLATVGVGSDQGTQTSAVDVDALGSADGQGSVADVDVVTDESVASADVGGGTGGGLSIDIDEDVTVSLGN